MIYIILAIVAVLLVYLFATYNNFIRLSNKVKEAFSTMDVYLKKRWDLIPNIVETVKGYAAHEQSTLEKVIEIRNISYEEMNNSDKLDVNQKLTGGITKLMMLAESYPDLKASQNFLNLSSQLTIIEDEIANSRKYYNAVVMRFNNLVEMFPSNLLAGIFGYKSEKMFEANSSEKENVKVEF